MITQETIDKLPGQEIAMSQTQEDLITNNMENKEQNTNMGWVECAIKENGKEITVLCPTDENT